MHEAPLELALHLGHQGRDTVERRHYFLCAMNCSRESSSGKKTIIKQIKSETFVDGCCQSVLETCILDCKSACIISV